MRRGQEITISPRGLVAMMEQSKAAAFSRLDALEGELDKAFRGCRAVSVGGVVLRGVRHVIIDVTSYRRADMACLRFLNDSGSETARMIVGTDAPICATDSTCGRVITFTAND